MKEEIGVSEFRQILLEETPIIDVRAPIEFAGGSIPESVNLPLLTNNERHEVGTTYKQKGRNAAIALGYELVSGDKKSARIAAWIDFLNKNPNAILTCFRGGLRSQTTQSWLAEAGFRRARIQGGYKAVRHFLLSELERLSDHPMCVISGNTGAGKTLLISEAQEFHSTVNLEFLAKHRGSAFGAYDEAQPSQADFENQLSLSLLKQCSRDESRPFVIEDESRMIGRCILPDKFFSKLRSSDVILLEEPIQARVQVIFDEYIARVTPEKRTESFDRYQKSIQIIDKKLGGLRFQEVSNDLRQAIANTAESGDLELHKVWIEKLLSWYYDPLYLKSLAKRNPRILFRGSRREALQFLKVSKT